MFEPEFSSPKKNVPKKPASKKEKSVKKPEIEHPKAAEVPEKIEPEMMTNDYSQYQKNMEFEN